MSSSDRTRSDPPARPRQTRTGRRHGAAQSGAEAYARWLEHMQRTRTRHAAITRNLYTWSNYKNWADKMRHDWTGRGPKSK